MAQTPAADSPPPFDPTLPPTSSLLFYLFADRVVPASRLGGVKAPLAEVRVATSQLACALLAVAVWQLRAAGLVLLEPVSERRLFKTTTHLRIARTSRVEDGRRDGIEGGILDLLTPGSLGKMTPAWEVMPPWLKDQVVKMESLRANIGNLPAFQGFSPPPRAAGKAAPETVTSVVGRWYGQTVPSPERVPIAWTEREGVAKGYLTVVDAHRNPITAVFLGETTHVAQRERIATLEPAFDQLLARWQAFKASEPGLAGELEREVDAGIASRQHVSDSSTSG